MHFIDWAIVIGYLGWILYDGIKRAKGSQGVEGYFLASRSLPWWAVGLSVMATQMSAITLVGTTGQGYSDGMRFVQFYFGLPVAMVILSVTLVPFFHRARVFTAYEYLEQRFDVKTRAVASSLFLLSRGLSVGVIIAAPAVILSIVLDWNLAMTILLIGVPTTAYTMFGGVQAVTWADVKQMVVIFLGMGGAVIVLMFGLPENVGLEPALHLAGATGRLESIDFSFNPNETYTFWSGLIGGLFLMLGYFGCDQSQVQRYLTANSIDAGRRSLLMSGFAKIPLQLLILLTGILVFIFYLFNQPPMFFNPGDEQRVRVSRAAEYNELNSEFEEAFSARRDAAVELVSVRTSSSGVEVDKATQVFLERDVVIQKIRTRAANLSREVSGGDSSTDVNYIFPTFVLNQLPVGLVGLMIAAIFAAAMSSIAAELNSLSTSTVIDFYRRHYRKTASEEHYLFVSKIVTGFWGVFASVTALYAVNLGSLIEVVNRFGSFFYGSLLGVFILAVGVPQATSRGAFWGLIGGMMTVIVVAAMTSISFLWLNLIGASAVFFFGIIISRSDRAVLT